MHRTPYHVEYEAEQMLLKHQFPLLSELLLRVPPDLRRVTVDEFLAETKEQTAAVEAVQDQIAEIERGAPVTEFKGLTLLGPPGIGKTMLACCVLVHTHQQKKSFDFMPSATLMELLAERMRHQERHPDTEEAWAAYDAVNRRLKELELVKVLVLDDIGKEYAANRLFGAGGASYIESELDRIIRTRWTTGAGKTIVTSNVPVEGWTERYRESMISFLHQSSHVIEILGTDRRRP